MDYLENDKILRQIPVRVWLELSGHSDTEAIVSAEYLAAQGLDGIGLVEYVRADEVTSLVLQPIDTAPKDGTFVLLRTPDSESGWTIAFWGGDQEDGRDGWYESEASSNAVFGKAVGWTPLPSI